MRKAIKRQAIPADELDETAAFYSKLGLVVIKYPEIFYLDRYDNYVSEESGGRKCGILIIAREKQFAERMFELSKAERQESPDKKPLIREIGKLLGYPACCTEFFLNTENTYDNNMLPVRTLLNTRGRLNPLLNRIGEYVFISHIPCGYNCKNSGKIARVVFDEIRNEYGQDTADKMLAANSARVVYFNRRSRITLEGHQRGDKFFYEQATGIDAPRALLDALNSGDSCRFHDKTLYVFKNGRTLFNDEIDGWFFNWGGNNRYAMPDSEKQARSETNIVSTPQITGVMKYVDGIIRPINTRGVGDWIYSRIRLCDGEISVIFEIKGRNDSFEFTLKKRKDNEKRFSHSLNFNMCYSPSVNALTEEQRMLSRVVAFIFNKCDNRAIPDEDWDALENFSRGNVLFWEKGRFVSMTCPQ